MIVFLIYELPLKKNIKRLKYTKDEIEEACLDSNMSRYLSQMRSKRIDMLCFVSSGFLHKLCRHRFINIFNVVGASHFEYGLKFSDTWPSQLFLIEKLCVCHCICMTLLEHDHVSKSYTSGNVS